MALFDSSDDAMKASTEMLKALADFNVEHQKTHETPLGIGVGLHKGRVRLGSQPNEWVTAALQRVGCHEAPVTHEVALETLNVRLSHRDPADRFLVATARVFDLKLVTADDRLIDLKAVPTLANR